MSNDAPTPASEEKKPVVDGDKPADYIKLKVVGQDGNEVQFRVKSSTVMNKLMKSYGERVGVPLTSLRFMFDGHRIANEDTPKGLELEDGDTIEVFTNQVGGS